MIPAASVLIPARNEEHDIGDCLEHVARQDIGAHRLEVLVADGRSEDRTRHRAEQTASSLGFGRFAVVDNPARGICAGLNTVLGQATAAVVVRVDARSRIEPHHVRTILDVLAAKPEVGVVGGAQVPIDRHEGIVGSGIARALSNRWSTGLGRYRVSTRSGPADTVWMGAFRTEELRTIGGWDPALRINEDYELNERYRAEGLVVWFEATLRSGYLPRRTFGALWRQYLAFGRSKGERWASGAPLQPRHAVLLSLPLVGTAAGVGLAGRLGWCKTFGLGVAGLAALDAAGAAGRHEPPAARVAAMAATCVTTSAWLTGVALGWGDAAVLHRDTQSRDA